MNTIKTQSLAEFILNLKTMISTTHRLHTGLKKMLNSEQP